MKATSARSWCRWARNHEVVGLDCGLFRECTLKAIRPVEKTIRQGRARRGGGSRRHRCVIHCRPVQRSARQPQPALEAAINHQAAVRLAELAKRWHPPLLYASTCSAYGAAGDDLLTRTARSIPSPRTPIQGAPRPHASPGGLPLPVACAATAYGVSPFLRFDLAVQRPGRRPPARCT
jgi:nucleoside-diphosphate-sugar epimerase